jgi:hypothetical protein
LTDADEDAATIAHSERAPFPPVHAPRLRPRLPLLLRLRVRLRVRLRLRLRLRLRVRVRLRDGIPVSHVEDSVRTDPPR